MRSLVFVGLLALATPAPNLAQAQDILACYARNYSDAHLAANPAQVVQSMVFAFEQGEAEVLVNMAVKVANGGHAKGGPLVGKWVRQGMFCFDGGAGQVGTRCAIECDAGSMEVVKVTPNSLTFRTNYLTVGEADECGGSIDIAERPGQPVSYKLMKADPKHCEALLP